VREPDADLPSTRERGAGDGYWAAADEAPRTRVFEEDDFPRGHGGLPGHDEVGGSGGRGWRWGWVQAGIAAGVLVGVVALVLFLILGSAPDELASSERAPGDTGATLGDVRIELAEPVDKTDHVELRWRSSRELDFAVVVAADGKPPQYYLAQRKNSLTIDIEPGRKYCFMIQATDIDRVYESAPVALRGATCRK
jgi:hypothetical protein